MSAKKYKVVLMDEERELLQGFIRKGKASAKKLARARILLKADESQENYWSDLEISQALDVGTATVERTRKRFVEESLESALTSKKREHPPIALKLDGEKEARLVALACSKAPSGRSNWTLQLLADRLVALEVVESIGRETVRQTLKKTKLNRG